MYDGGIVMRGEGMKRIGITRLNLFALSKGASVRQSMSHPDRCHSKKNGNENDCWDKN